MLAEDSRRSTEKEMAEESDEEVEESTNSKSLRLWARWGCDPSLRAERTVSRLRPLIVHPDHWSYVAWTHFILVWAIYSSFFTPMEFAFFRGLQGNLFLLDVAGQIAFLVDIVVQFFLAYRDSHSHRIIDDPGHIAFRYLKSRFTFDFLGCLPWDVIFKACGRKELVRCMLWIRLSRVLRVTEFFEKLEKDIRINYLFTRIVKLLVVELYCTHAAACIFYYLATTVPPAEEGYTWIGSLEMGDYKYSDFRDIDLWKRYFTSLYFAIITMATVGYGDIHPVNVREMIFVMVYVSLDMILGAYLLGNMTALMVKGSKTERFRDKMTELIKYMNRNKLERKISDQIKSHLRLQYDRSYTEEAVLQDIPVSIRNKISQKLYEPFIKEVYLFKGCSSQFIKQISIRVHEEFFLPGEVIVEQGVIVDQMHIVCHGELEEVGRRRDDTEEPPTRLLANSSVGEISFLSNIVQPYTVRVCELSRILRLDKQSFLEILDISFSDSRILMHNLLEGRDPNLRNKLQESGISLFIAKHESELVSRLNCAAHNGDVNRLKGLLAAGADPSKTDYDGRSPLHVAASRGYEEIIALLMQRGVDINTPDRFGNTPLLEAIKNGHDHIITCLVQAKAVIKMDDAGGFLCSTVARRHPDLLKGVLANGINPNAKNYDFRTPLHVAAAEGLLTEVKLLLEAGASALPKDRWGNTPLDEARVGGNKGLFDLLVSARANELSEISSYCQGIKAKSDRKKCTVFPFHPWNEKERKVGVVMWVAESMEEMIEAAAMRLEQGSSACILSEDGGKILDTNLISDGQKVYLANAD